MSSQHSQHKVLLVDDEPQLLAGLRIHVRREYDVYAAPGGAEALEIIREHGPFAVIVSDMRMPRMDGVEFLREARAVTPKTVRILLTGYADVESAIGAVNDGKIFRFLTKPCPPPQLLQAIGEAVAEYEKGIESDAFVRGERHRVSKKIVKAGRMAALGSMASGAGRRLQSIAKSHHELLDTVIAQAASGGFVSVDELEELRDVETDLVRAATYLQDFASTDDEATVIDLRELAEHAAEAFAGTQADADIEVLTDFIAGTPTVIGAPSQLEQVLVNLLSNAIDAVKAVDRPGRIVVRVRYRPEDDRVLCEVVDNGCGIHAEARPFVMRPYFSTKGQDGTGLGLPVAQKIIESWNGQLTYQSRYGHGSTFGFSLPSAAEHDAITSNNRDDVRPRAAERV